MNLSDFTICDTNIVDIDCDNDGVPNGLDAFPVEICASVDTDGDGSPDSINGTCRTLIVDEFPTDSSKSCTSNPSNENSNQIDCDNDNIVNGMDAFRDDPCASADTDGDGFANQAHNPATVMTCTDTSTVMIDNCPFVSNDQQNTDSDSMGDACDMDDDNDTIPDVSDNCPLVSNTSQLNGYGSSMGDACDDTDGDTINDDTDNCPNDSNTSQADNYGSSMGDACDDTDGDNINDDTDNCPLDSNPMQINSDTDMMGNACDTDDDNDTIDDVTDVDDDNDRLIEITTLIDLHNVRFDLDGSHLDDETDDTGANIGNNTGCPPTGCNGYELMNDLNFDSDGDGRTWDASSLALDSGDNESTYFDTSNGGWNPLGNFTGTFEGNGYTIRNLAIRRNNTNIGLFSHILSSGGRVRNLMIADSLADYTGNANSDVYVGILAGRSSGRITGVGTSGRSDGGGGNKDYVGGLVGKHNSTGRIISSYATGTANGGNGTDRVGGLVGWNEAGRIIASYATGTANGGNGTDRVGGLVGSDETGTIIASYSTGNANGGGGDSDSVGGFVGRVEIFSTITASYSTGNANGGAGPNDWSGRLLGQRSNSTITDSYAFGTRSGENMGVNGIGTETSVTDPSMLMGTNWPTIWDFGTTSEKPALRWVTSLTLPNTYSCDQNLLPPGQLCANLIPGQGR